MSIIKLATTAIMIIALAKLSLLDGFSVMESLAVIQANIGYYLTWPSQPGRYSVIASIVGILAIIPVIGYLFPSKPDGFSVMESLAVIRANIRYNLTWPGQPGRYSVIASLLGIRAIIPFIGYLFPSKPDGFSVMESLAVIQTNIGYYLTWPSQPDGFSVMESLAVIQTNIGYYLTWPSQLDGFSIMGSLAVIRDNIGYYLTWPIQPDGFSVMESLAVIRANIRYYLTWPSQPDDFSVMESLAVILANIGYYLTWPSQPGRYSVIASLACILANIGYYLTWPSQPVLALLVGSLAIISVIVYRIAWPSQPGKTSLMEAYNQNICPIPLPWEEYFLATNGEKMIIRHDQLISNTDLYAETQVRITWPDGKAEQMSTLSFFQSDKSKTLRRVLFVGDIGCGKTSFVKQVSFLWSQRKTDEIFLFFLNLQNTNLNGNMAEEISKQLPEDCKIENIEFIIKNERCLLIFDGSNEFSDLNLKLGLKESGEQSYLTFQNFVKLAEVNTNVRIWLTSRPCLPRQFRDSFAVVNFLSFKEDELKSYIKQMCVYYKTLKEQVQFPIKNFQELSRETEVEPHGNDDVNVITRSVWSILERNDLLKLDADALLMGIVIQLLVSSKYGIMNKHTVGIDLTTFPPFIKVLIKCLYLRHVVVTKHFLTATAIENMELIIGRLFLKEDTLSIEQLEEGKRDISLLCGILKICPNSGKGKLDKDSTTTGYGFRCRHQFIQELCVAKYLSTDKQKLKDFRKSSNKNDEGMKKRILMLIDNN